MTHVNPILNQTDFRFREDSGNEATATFLADLNTNISIDVDTDFRYRVVVAETAGSTNPATVNLLLEFSLNTGAFAAVTGSSAVQFATFTGSSDTDATTQQLGSGTFVAGELDNTGAVSDLDLQSSETEMEYCLTLDSGQINNDDTIDLRVVDGGADLNTYGNTGRATAIAVLNTLLVIQEASHAHTADNLDIHVDLTIDDSDHAHTADNLAMNTDLTIAEASHAHTADNLDIGITINIADADHAHTADNLDIHVDLNIAEALHTHTADNVIIELEGAFPDGWERAQSIIIDNTEVIGSGSHTNFPMLITLDHLDTEVVDAGSNSALNGGGDIRFSTDADGDTQIALEVINFVTNATEATRRCELWVRVPSLSTSVDTTIYIWYKNAGESQPASSDTFGSEAVWADYLVVAHLNEAANTDSEGYANATGGTGGTGVSMALSLVQGPFDSTVAAFDGSPDKIAFPISLSASDDEFFVQAWGFVDSLTGDDRLFSVGEGTGGTDTEMVVWMDADGAGDGWRSIYKNAAGDAQTEIGTDADDDAIVTTWQSLGFRNSNSDAEMYLDGSSKGTGTGGAFSDGTNDADEFLIANLWNSTSSTAYFTGGIAEARLRFDTVIDDGWVTTEYNNANTPAVFADPGTPFTPGTTTLVIADADHAHTADNLDIHIDLAIDDSDHAHTADNLAMNTDLTVAEALHAHTADNLAMNTDLTIAEALHGHTADNLDIHVDLAINEALHLHTADNVVIEAGITLVIQEANHAHAADNIDIHVDLSINDALHAHTADNVVIEAGTLLVIQDADHAHSADNLDIHVDLAIDDTDHSVTSDNLAMGTDLSIQEALHAHAAENLDIAVDLFINGASHDHTADNITLGIGLINLEINDALMAVTSDNILLVRTVGEFYPEFEAGGDWADQAENTGTWTDQPKDTGSWS